MGTLGRVLPLQVQITCWNWADERNSLENFFRLLVLSQKFVRRGFKNWNATILAVQELLHLVVSGFQGDLRGDINAGDPFVYHAHDLARRYYRKGYRQRQWIQAKIQEMLFVHKKMNDEETYRLDETSSGRERQLYMQKYGQQSQLKKRVQLERVSPFLSWIWDV